MGCRCARGTAEGDGSEEQELDPRAASLSRDDLWQLQRKVLRKRLRQLGAAATEGGGQGYRELVDTVILWNAIEILRCSGSSSERSDALAAIRSGRLHKRVLLRGLVVAHVAEEERRGLAAEQAADLLARVLAEKLCPRSSAKAARRSPSGTAAMFAAAPQPGRGSASTSQAQAPPVARSSLKAAAAPELRGLAGGGSKEAFPGTAAVAYASAFELPAATTGAAATPLGGKVAPGAAAERLPQSAWQAGCLSGASLTEAIRLLIDEKVGAPLQESAATASGDGAVDANVGRVGSADAAAIAGAGVGGTDVDSSADGRAEEKASELPEAAASPGPEPESEPSARDKKFDALDADLAGLLQDSNFDSPAVQVPTADGGRAGAAAPKSKGTRRPKSGRA